MRTPFHVFANNYTVDDAAVPDNCADLDNMLTDLNVEVSDPELEEELHPVPAKRKVPKTVFNRSFLLRYPSQTFLKSAKSSRKKRYAIK